IPIEEDNIKELYIIAVDVYSNNKLIPVHIFPCKMDEEKGIELINKMTESNPSLKRFYDGLRKYTNSLRKEKVFL
ncbi:MAG: hypothetical protein ABDH37_02190, partial [Candidatus Hydrothermales bacterium]